MAPLITLYLLGACVAVAAGLFVVMLVLTAVRPPRLPDVHVESPPPTLQRVIRALTPPPVAMAMRATAMPVAALPVAAIVHRDVITSAVVPPPIARPTSARPPVAQPPIATSVRAPVAQPIARAPVAQPVARAPVAQPIARAPVAQPTIAKPSAARPSLGKPSVTLPPHVGSVGRRFIPLGPAPLAAAAPASRSPVYPVKRARMLPRVLLGVLATTVVAAGVAIAYPQLLDPLCDDYEWFGGDVATALREHARDARATIADWLARL